MDQRVNFTSAGEQTTFAAAVHYQQRRSFVPMNSTVVPRRPPSTRCDIALDGPSPRGEIAPTFPGGLGLIAAGGSSLTRSAHLGGPRGIRKRILSDLPDDIQNFIAINISSVAQLELLLLLRAEADREWSADDVSQALRAAASGMAGQLEDLEAKGLLYVTHSPESRFRYRPRDAEQDAVVARLADLYRERRVAVISLIYSERIDKARSFADAFRIRKEKES
jgi:hypothetical protein